MSSILKLQIPGINTVSSTEVQTVKFPVTSLYPSHLSYLWSATLQERVALIAGMRSGSSSFTGVSSKTSEQVESNAVNEAVWLRVRCREHGTERLRVLMEIFSSHMCSLIKTWLIMRLYNITDAEFCIFAPQVWIPPWLMMVSWASALEINIMSIFLKKKASV